VILGFSTSSEWTSTALLSPDGRLVDSEIEHAPRRASETIWVQTERILARAGVELQGITGLMADTGPGSFTGVRVGVVFAKTLAFLNGVRCAGATAFDLIAAEALVSFPSKKGEFYVREIGQDLRVQTDFPAGAVGFGPGVAEPTYPSAARFGDLFSRLNWVAPEAFMPEYVLPPSISLPKRPFRHV
jgi:tRNA threonylcarbamoyl adenosine modification protein YeaZ